MADVWFTADTHWGHANIVKFCARPFPSVREMNTALTENWNARVKPGDTVYHLGDFSWGDQRPYLKHLNGAIVLIRGSHDKNIKPGFQAVHDLLVLRDVAPVPIVLCHYAFRIWPSSHYGAWHLYGHSHCHLPPYGKSFDVGVDCHNYAPISLDEVVEIMETLPDNPNLVRPRTPTL